MVLFSSLYEPFKAAFLPIDRAMSGWEWFVDATFYADILLSFWTGFDRGYEVVMARQEIFKNYLTGWFAVDLLATVEWDLLGGALIRLATAGNAQQEGHTALLRLTRLLKVVRIVKGPRLILNLTKTTTIHTAYIDAAQFFALVLIVAHNLGCFFFMVPALFMDCVPALYTVSSTSRDNEASWFGGEIGERIDAHLDPGCNGVCGICRESAANGTPVPTSIGIIPGSWRDFYDIEQQPPPDQYVDALYWSLTTMTTIGYGDRSPHLQCEIIYAMVAEVLGLSFFAMLLNEISILQEVASERADFANEEKNAVVSFLKHNDLDTKLIQEVVGFLNFRAKGHSGRSMKPGVAQHFQELSMPMKQRIKQQIFLRPLREVVLFGHSKLEADESRELKKMFDDIDEDGGGSLDSEEIMALLNQLQIRGISMRQVELMMREMSSDGDATETSPVSAVNFEQFSSWWHVKQHGREKIERCPEEFLLALATAMSNHLKVYGKHEQVIGPYVQTEEATSSSSSGAAEAATAASANESCVQYGKRLGFILGGTVVIVKNPARDDDVVSRAEHLSNPAFIAAAEQMGEQQPHHSRNLLLSEPDRRGRVVAGSVNQMLRTCKVIHLEPDGSPVTVKDHNGKWSFEKPAVYHLADLQVVQRARPRHLVHDKLHLQATPGRRSVSSGNRPSTVERCALTGIEYGGVVPAGEVVTEQIGREGKPMPRAGQHGDYVLVSWDGPDGKPQRIGWVKVSHSLLSVSAGAADADAGADGGGTEAHASEGADSVALSWTVRDGEIRNSEICCWVEDSKTVRDDDAEPMFGLASVLGEEDFALMSAKTSSWVVETVSFVDMAFITRAELLRLLQEYWPHTTTGDRGGKRVGATTPTWIAAIAAKSGTSNSGCELPLSVQPEMIGGQQALGQLALMEHDMSAAAAGTKLQSDSTIVQPQHGQRSTQHQRQKLPVRSFEDCSERFDTLEAQLTGVLAMQKQVLDAVAALQARPG